MLDQYSTAIGPANIIGIDLHTIWNVRADSTYRFNHDYSLEKSRHLHQHGGTGLICIRTHKGHGRIVLSTEKILDVLENSIVLLRWDELASYFCQGRHWDLWWFEFTVTGPLHIPLNMVIKVIPMPNEQQLFQQAFASLRKTQFTQRCLASVAVTQLLYHWLASRELPEQASPYCDVIEHVIELLHKRMTPAWTVQEMAREANMSERNFRKVFREITGQSPKKFYNQLRLSFARQLLSRRAAVFQVADMLGFSSPYHFSREFKQFFGFSPSKSQKSKP
jgi:AraC-like DNA-binding protein